MAKTLEQQIAEAEARLARLRTKERRKETRRKIIVGGMIIANAIDDPAAARKLAAMIEAKVTRSVDKADIEPLLEELRAVTHKVPAEPVEKSVDDA